MTYPRTLEIIIKDIQDIEKLVINFNNYSHIPQIELDLALSKLRNLYDLLLMYKQLGSEEAEGTLPKEINDKEEIIPEEEVTGNSGSEIPDKTVTDDLLLDAANKSKRKEKMISSESSEQQTEAAEEIREEIVRLQKKQQAILSEKLAGKQEFINEKLGNKSNKDDLSSRLLSSSIQSISGSMGINDKFFFIRELFGGDPILFREAMEQLDNMPNFNAALDYLKSNFQWDFESSTVKQLMNLVRRKLIRLEHE